MINGCREKYLTVFENKLYCYWYFSKISEGWSSLIILNCHLQIVCHLISRQRDRFYILEETCPLSTAICFRFFKKLNHKFKMLSDIPFCVSFKIRSSCHTLSNALKTTIHLMIYGILYTEKKKKTLRSFPPTSNMSHGHVLKSYYVLSICSNPISATYTNLNPL